MPNKVLLLKQLLCHWNFFVVFYIFQERDLLLQNKKSNPQQYLHSIELLALQKMPNVLLTPHNAFNTIEALQRINQITADNIVKFWYGNIPNKVVHVAQMGKLVVNITAEA